MGRITVTLVAFGFVIALAPGCGPASQSTAPGSGEAANTKPGEPAQPIAKGKPADGVYRSGAELIADMPKTAYPKSGPMGNAERRDAEKWLRANVVGRTVEWTATVTEVSDKGNGPYDVEVANDGAVTLVNSFGATSDYSHTCGTPVSLGDESCQFLVDWPRMYEPEYKSCTRSELDTLRKSKGKKVAFRATVTGVDVMDDIFVKSTKRQLIKLKVASPSVDGFLPEAAKAKDSK